MTIEIDPPVTWMDVARALGQIEPTSDLWLGRPKELIRADIDWSAATFEFDGDAIPEAAFHDWLEKVFPQRIERSDAEASLILEGPKAERLPIELELRQAPIAQLMPIGAIESSVNFRPEPLVSNGGLPIIACHSVKGGSGRTTAAIACAIEWARRARKPVLIVDADLEAPGLSYLFQRSRGHAKIAFEDIVALAHRDASPAWEDTIDFAAGRLRDQRIDDIFVLPLRRNLEELASSSIRAEHLSTPERPFALAELLRAIADRTDCAGIVVDIRAGLVPLAAQLILDPSVGRMFVCTLAGQSLDGTAALIAYLSREARRRNTILPEPLLLVNRIPSIIRETGADESILRPVLDRVTVELLRGRDAATGADEAIFSVEQDISAISVVRMPEISDLQVSSAGWDGFVEQLRSSGFQKRITGDFGDWLTRTLDDMGAASTAPNLPTLNLDVSHQERCKLLRTFAGKLVAAELAEAPIETPLITGPLRALAEQFKSQLPVIVAEGAKGTGKTLTARFVAARGDWVSVVEALSGASDAVDAPILPVLGSIQSSEAYQVEIDSCRQAVAAKLGFGQAQTVYETKSYLNSALTVAANEQERATVWLNSIAWAAGFDVGNTTAGERFPKELRDRGQNLLVVIEGIEELYKDPFSGNTPLWLRSLLVDLPQRVRAEPGRPIGLIIFARRDSVDAAVPQNSDQFRRAYQSFALSWSDSDVIELAAWLATKSGALDVWTPAFRSMPQAEKEERLYPLWGRKLGPDDKPSKRTAEAYTANWVIAVLSDLQSRLVARDLVRLLENAAAASVSANDVEFSASRLLAPRALKDAVKPTSVAKVSETQEEIAELKPVFDKFRKYPDSVVAPLDSEAIVKLGLSEADIRLLQRHAILFGDSPPYEVPELFRMGLNLKHSGARHSVINLRRRARQRLGLTS
ncbi:hypothetical protein OSH10_15115 [Kaistia defluvii]|uniref:KGGVGR-motif variant AAA ATPase n=1 Tax=Kaistia defluvii TaxID=410841 RepID=UPI0022586592|nr:hypothetical protein [Kaistia defluvii]MCX5519772.1 hypothetical protein [Kaistia defluvii]